jgi:hypothetical protein
MSATERIGASHVTRSRCAARTLGFGCPRRIFDQRVREAGRDVPIELRICRPRDRDGLVVLALEIDDVDRAGGRQLGDHRCVPADGGHELEAQGGVPREPGLQRGGRGLGAGRDNEAQRPRFPLEQFGQRPAGLP